MSRSFDPSLLQYARTLLLDEEHFDYILVFTNLFEVEDSNTIEIAQARVFIKDIFKPTVVPNDMLDEETSLLFDSIQAQMEAFLAENNVGGEISFKALGLEIMKHVFMVLQNYLKLELETFFSRDRDELFVKLRATEHNLQVHAHLIEYSLQFRPSPEYPETFAAVPPYANFLKPTKKSGIGLLTAKPVDIKQIFKTYNHDDTEANGDGMSYFQYKDKVRLISSMINNVIGMSSLAKIGLLLQEYPVHRKKQLSHLKETWANFRNILKKQDLEIIREYYGEKVGFYFALLEFYIYWLIVPALFGIVTFILYMTANQDAADSSSKMTLGELMIFAFSMFLCFYSTLFDQMWVREEHRLSWTWGTWTQSMEEPQRPDFQGEIGVDEITGKVKKLKTPEKQDLLKKLLSMSVVFIFVGLVISAIIAIFMYRATVNHTSWGPAVCAIINAIQIKVFNIVYSYLARILNNWENYETNSSYYDALSIKLYLFQFVNSYASLFYIAFAKGRFEGCTDNNCMDELSTQLTYIFLTNIGLNVLELGWPFAYSKFKDYMERRRLEQLHAQGESVRLYMNSAEQQSKKFIYGTPLDDFMEVVIQYGYVVMFCSSFAMSPILALVINALEVRIDAWKLCYLTQRPFPEIASSIGVWYSILVTISYFGALTNAAIVVFTANVFDIGDTQGKFFVFLLIEHALLISKFLLSIAIPDEPTIVKSALVWNDRIAKEKLHNRFSNKSKEREAWSLFYKPRPEQEVIPFDRRAIEARLGN